MTGKCEMPNCLVRATGGGEGGKQLGPGFLEGVRATPGWKVDRTKPLPSGVWSAPSRKAGAGQAEIHSNGQSRDGSGRKLMCSGVKRRLIGLMQGDVGGMSDNRKPVKVPESKKNTWKPGNPNRMAGKPRALKFQAKNVKVSYWNNTSAPGSSTSNLTLI